MNAPTPTPEPDLQVEPADFYMIWTKNGRPPKFRHDDRGAAVAEAGRLARKHPGRKFIILHGVEKVRVPRPDQPSDAGEPGVFQAEALTT